MSVGVSLSPNVSNDHLSEPFLRARWLVHLSAWTR
jgi:hypothetical protein